MGDTVATAVSSKHLKAKKVEANATSIRKQINNYYGSDALAAEPSSTDPKVEFEDVEPVTSHFVGRDSIGRHIIKFFNERETEIARLREADSKSMTSLNPLQCCFLLYGRTGIGKTELARYVISKYRDGFYRKKKKVAWLTVDGNSPEKAFRQLATYLGTEAEGKFYSVIATVYEHFAQHIGSGIFVFDQVEDVNEFHIDEFIPSSTSSARPLILILSRTADSKLRFKDKHCSLVPPLTREEVIGFFHGKFPTLKDGGDLVDTSLGLLADTVEGCPKVMHLVSQFIRFRKSKPLEAAIDDINRYLKSHQGKLSQEINQMWKTQVGNKRKAVTGELLSIMAHLECASCRIRFTERNLLKLMCANVHAFHLSHSEAAKIKRRKRAPSEDELEDAITELLELCLIETSATPTEEADDGDINNGEDIKVELELKLPLTLARYIISREYKRKSRPICPCSLVPLKILSRVKSFQIHGTQVEDTPSCVNDNYNCYCLEFQNREENLT